MLGRTYALGHEPDLEEALLTPAAPEGVRPDDALGDLVSAAAPLALSSSCRRRSSG